MHGRLACDGAGRCFDKDVGGTCANDYECVSGHCADGFCCDIACDRLCEACRGDWTSSANGTCAPITGGTDPDNECIDTANCAGSGTCTATADIGTPCGHDGQCNSSHCVDGFCCDSACDTGCMACTESITGSSNGTCAAVPEPFDPDADCVSSGGFGCNGAGACNPVKTWGTAVRIEENSNAAKDWKVAMSADGDAVAVWLQSNGGEDNVWASRYVPGAGWSSPTIIQLQTSFEAFHLDLGMSPNGDAVVAWAEYDTSEPNYNLWANRYVVGSGWTTATTLESTFEPATQPAVAVSANGDAVVLWLQNVGHYNLWAGRFIAGEGWQTPELIEFEEGDPSPQPRAHLVAMDGGGNATAIWEIDDQGHYDMWMDRLNVETGWSGAVRLEEGPDNARAGSVAMDLAGNAFVTWGQSGGWYVRYAAGVGWGTPTQLAEYGGIVAVDSIGGAIRVWGGLEDGWSSRYSTGFGWSPPVQFSDNYVTGTAVCSDWAGNAVVAWRDSAYDLWASRFAAASGAWGAPVQLGSIASMEYVSIGMDRLGNAVAVWQQDDDIWAATFR